VIKIASIFLLSLSLWGYTPKSYEVVGSGANSSLQVARDLARQDIANTISSNVISSTSMRKKSTQESFESEVKVDLKVQSSLILSNTKEIEKFQVDGIWYVKLVYDNRTLLEKIKAKKSYIQSSQPQNSYLEKSPFIRKVYQSIGRVNTKILRNNNNWYLRLDNERFVLTSNDIVNLFSNTHSKDLTLSSKRSYRSEEYMGFEVQSKLKGFISFVYIESNGKVGVIYKNLPIEDKLSLGVDELMAYNPSKSTIIEQYIVIYSNRHIDLSEFENVSEEVLDESNYNFHKLLELLNTHPFSSIKIKIKPL
jgi:hypothetical protein